MINSKIYSFLAIILIWGVNTLLAQQSGKIIRVIDGDTFMFKFDKSDTEIKVRLQDIDCPERDQPFGNEAIKFMESFMGKKMLLKVVKKDKHKRSLSYLFDNEININYLMIEKGYAWKWKFCKQKSLDALQNKAKEQKLGLWALPNPINPNDWRKK